MAGKPSELKKRVVEALRKLLASTPAGAEKEAIAALRKEFEEAVPLRTWQLWVREVLSGRDEIKSRVEAAVDKAARAAADEARKRKEQRAADARQAGLPELPDKRKRRSRTGDAGAGAAEQKPLEGEHIPGGSGGGSDDPPAAGFTQRFINPRKVETTPRAIIEQLGELLLDCEALRDCSIREFPGMGHIILDPMAFGQSIALRERILSSQVKLYKDALSSETLDEVLKAITQRLDERDPELARQVGTDMRAILSHYFGHG
jgi:hypothetical protein